MGLALGDIEILKRCIAHDSCRAGDREPRGAVLFGQDVHVLLRVRAEARSSVVAAYLLVVERPGDVREKLIQPCDAGFAGTVSLEAYPHVAF